ncbi:hypothetical protein [uncultured Ilyobacter sp.]|uniref:hypothetical protein n=1 Tax=uncultured Ilyobacter sp. TaxID=544433 RepID=UPI0029C69AF9|nr:hypothetical protein [uncultured Ilyobacter sp.]
MQILTTINNLEPYKIKGIKYEGYEKDSDGSILNTSESGKEYNIIRWLKHKYALSLQWLTYDEIESIIKQFQTAKINEEKVTITKSKLTSKGYFDLKTTAGEPVFSFELTDLKPSQKTGTSFYDLSITLIERVDLA